jgi:hypothetical protein
MSLLASLESRKSRPAPAQGVIMIVFAYFAKLRTQPYVGIFKLLVDDWELALATGESMR